MLLKYPFKGPEQRSVNPQVSPTLVALTLLKKHLKNVYDKKLRNFKKIAHISRFFTENVYCYLCMYCYV